MRNLQVALLLLAFAAGCEKADVAPLEVHSETVDERAVTRLEDAVEREDFDATLAIVTELKGSTNAAVRLRCVESIGWFGGKSAKILEPFLWDSDEDVRSEAEDQWDSALNDIEDAHERGVLVESAMLHVRDRDIMDTAAAQLNDLPPSLAIDIIVHLIGGSNGVARVAAKESYEYITGDEWRSAMAAQKWIEENQDQEEEEDE